MSVIATSKVTRKCLDLRALGMEEGSRPKTVQLVLRECQWPSQGECNAEPDLPLSMHLQYQSRLIAWVMMIVLQIPMLIAVITRSVIMTNKGIRTGLDLRAVGMRCKQGWRR